MKRESNNFFYYIITITQTNNCLEFSFSSLMTDIFEKDNCVDELMWIVSINILVHFQFE